MINSNNIPKYVSELRIPPIFKPTYEYDPYYDKKVLTYDIDIIETKEQMLPSNYPKTSVYAYAGLVYTNNCSCGEYKASAPGPTFMAYTDQPISVRWNNKLYNPHMFPVDPTLHWANPNNMAPPTPPFKQYPPGYEEAQYPIPTVTHLHGGETESKFDGFPDSWFTHNNKFGPTYETNIYRYLNEQQSSNLFYHDHTLGMTRLNVYAGLSGAYLIKDPSNYLDDECITPLPSGEEDIVLLIEDKTFNEDGSLYVNPVGTNPDTHPYWRASILGNTIVVNGVVWPNLNVKNTAYRFRIINGSNSRFYTFKLSNNEKIIQIGSDGGYLEEAVYMDEIYLAPAERADIIIDFSKNKLDDEIILLNINDNADPNTTGQVMRFKVDKKCHNKPLCLPNKLNNIPTLNQNISKRVVTLNVALNNTGLEAFLLNGQKWGAEVSEKPIVGSMQMWEIVNLTNGPHPIHIHLSDSQILNRQLFDRDSYSNDWNMINGSLPLQEKTKVIDPNSYLIGNPISPGKNEMGWKDTVVCPPNMVTRLILAMYPSRLDPCCIKLGKNLFPFDPSSYPGYVWHCHMLDHEDNEMMRPMEIINPKKY